MYEIERPREPERLNYYIDSIYKLHCIVGACEVINKNHYFTVEYLSTKTISGKGLEKLVNSVECRLVIGWVEKLIIKL